MHVANATVHHITLQSPPGEGWRSTAARKKKLDTERPGYKKLAVETLGNEPLVTNIIKEGIEGKTVYLEAGTVLAYMSHSGTGIVRRGITKLLG